MLNLALSVLAAASLSLNFYLFYKLRSQKNQLKRVQEVKPSYEAEQLMHDLTSGVAVVKITRISPGDIFLRSPHA
jgi:hypothetical protein